MELLETLNGGIINHLACDLDKDSIPPMSTIAKYLAIAENDYNFDNKNEWGTFSDINTFIIGGYQQAGYAYSPAGSITITDGKPIVVTFSSYDNDKLRVKSKTNNVLPIELIEFYGECNIGVAELHWTTASEKNNEWFVVEKSADAINFSEIARIAGAGNSIEELEYTYTDNNAIIGNNYYRLRQVDYDGMESYSEIIAVICNSDDASIATNPAIYAYPNPFHDEISIAVENMNEEYMLEIFNELGEVVYMSSANIVEMQNFASLQILQMNNLPSGTYFIRVTSENHVLNSKIVKQ